MSSFRGLLQYSRVSYFSRWPKLPCTLTLDERLRYSITHKKRPLEDRNGVTPKRIKTTGPVLLIRFGVTPFLSSRGLFLQPTVKSLSVRGFIFFKRPTLSLRSRLQLLEIPFCLLWASFNDRHFKTVESWFDGQFENIICIFCVRSLMVAFPSCKNRLWMVNSSRRKVFPNGDWLLTIRRAMSRNSSRPKTTVILLKVRRFMTIPLELRFSTVKQHSNSLASITLSK